MYHGLINSVAKSIEEYCESTVEIVTPTMTVNKPDWEFIGQYRAKQEDAVNTIVEKRFGVLKAVVRFGKTVVVAACVAKLKTSPVAIIVYQQEQLDHFYKIVEEFTNIDNIGIVGDSTVRIGDVTIYMMQSLIAAKSRGDDDYVWSEFKKSKVVFCDELHHSAADGGSEVLDALTNVECLVGVSGTPWREDGRQEFLTALFGDVIFEVGIGTAIEHDLICPITVFVDDVPAKNYGIIDHIRDAADNGVEVNQFHVRRQYQNVYNDYIVNNKTRHKIIADFVDEVRNENLTCAVIVRIKKHADQLKSHIPDSHIVVANTKDRKSQLDALRQREIDCVITTLLDEAVDIPSLDVVILAAGGKSQTKLTQRLRNLTKFEGELSTGHYKKERAYILYLNDDADFLKTHSKTNIKNLKQIVKQHKRNEFIWRNNGI